MELGAADEDVFRTLEDLVSINSVNPSFPDGRGEKEISDYIAHFFDANGIPYEFQPVSEGRANVIARLDGTKGRNTLLLEAHMDTVSGKGMSIDPFRPVRKGRRLYGLGSCDTKGGLAAMLHAMKVLHGQNKAPRPSVVFAAVVDEECDFKGINTFIGGKPKIDGAVVAEPTHLRIVTATKGILRWEITSTGKAAHSSKPHNGLNAIYKMASLLTAIAEQMIPKLEKQQHPLLGSPTVNVGLIRGGVQLNTVPNNCAVQVDRRLLPNETCEQVWKEFTDLIALLKSRDPELNISMQAPFLEYPPLETNLDENVVHSAATACKEVLGTASIEGVPFGSDASKLSLAGIPSLICGPGAIDQAHSSDEFIELDQVVLAQVVYLRTISEFGSERQVY